MWILSHFIRAEVAAAVRTVAMLLDHGRKMGLRLDEGAGRAVGIDVAVIAQLASVMHGSHLPALWRGMGHVLVAALHARIQALAQALFGGTVPLAVGVDAMHEDDHARRRCLHQTGEFAVIELGDATCLAYHEAGNLARFCFMHGALSRSQDGPL